MARKKQEITEEDIKRWESKSRGFVRYLGVYCEICGRETNTWDEKIQNALKYKSEICEACIAEEYGLTVEGLRERMQEKFGLLPCRGI